MELPFTHEQFLGVFGAYNEAMWPVAAILWLLSAVAIAVVLAGRGFHRSITVLLAAHWAWVAVAYHWIHFTAINPAASAFAVGFLIQALLLAWVASRRPLEYRLTWSPRHVAGIAFALYGLLYPLLAAATVGAYPRMPTFGVPCPTTLYTIGLLLLASRPRPWLFVVPLLWATIGGSAAVLLAVTLDYALLVAGAAVLVYLVAAHVRRQRTA